jgi:hypothetical protein
VETSLEALNSLKSIYPASPLHRRPAASLHPLKEEALILFAHDLVDILVAAQTRKARMAREYPRSLKRRFTIRTSNQP